MSPTVFREKGFRFFFFSREEARMHVHVQSGSGRAKFWISPRVELVQSLGLSHNEISEALSLVRDRKHEIREAWVRHFGQSDGTGG